ncbi:MAG: hypothetical protein IPP26_10510 [Flavobacteriales bacterium]|nr:hypothetical protein [Flavobacteriales bacterium]
MTRVFHISTRLTAMFSLALIMLLSACSREDVSPLNAEFPGVQRAGGQQENEAMDQDGALGGNTLRSDDVTEDGGMDTGGISDDGDDTGDSERNRKNKGNN